ncbi:hypothetical protein NPIL_277351 [Nephila pilipes]|uniref:Uncharacterized protein n=1 Tax=Nephila pilipes TaxID=299642 RepID=A0A8X6R4N2_NEPPI|nr:hypothetical protein NPIL_277351 [Nephila pilipes]
MDISWVPNMTHIPLILNPLPDPHLVGSLSLHKACRYQIPFQHIFVLIIRHTVLLGACRPYLPKLCRFLRLFYPFDLYLARLLGFGPVDTIHLTTVKTLNWTCFHSTRSDITGLVEEYIRVFE